MSGTALISVVALCVFLTACRFELAADPGSITPTAEEVRLLLADDRVRQALDRAEELAERYRDPQSQLVLAWALWRNGEVRAAETHFRRAADAGLDEGLTGLAAIRASSGDWEAAERLAVTSLATPMTFRVVHAMLAGVAWSRHDADATARALHSWSASEPGTPRGRAAAAMASAVARLQGPVRQWRGEASELPLLRTSAGDYAVEAYIGGERVVLLVNLMFRQSVLAPLSAAAAGLVVDGEPASADAAGRVATDRWPAILSPRQAAVPQIDFGAVSLRNVVVAVADPPEGVDGVLAMDLLGGARWTLDTAADRIVLIPPDQASTFDSRRTDGAAALAWMNARVIVDGLAVQLLLFPRVQNQTMAAGLDLSGDSRLDSDILPVTAGSGVASTRVALGGWQGDVLWRPSSLIGWAADGGIAPSAVLGGNLIDGWTLHWFPASQQLRIDRMEP